MRGEGRHRRPASSGISWSCDSSRWLYTPAVRSSRMPLADGRQRSASRGRHHFFPKRSFNAALSSMESANSRFSSVFSSSSALSRLASETSIPPRCASFVDAGVADAYCGTDRRPRPRFVLLQYPDDLLFRKAAALHAWSSSWAGANFKMD